MSLGYKVLERCLKAVNIKKIYSMPEDKLFDYLKSNHRAYDVPQFLYKHLKVEKTEFNGRLLFKFQPNESESSNTILFIHGGGGMMCPTLIHYRFAERLVKNTGATLYFPFYPLGPESSINESILWLDSVYESILKNVGEVTEISEEDGVRNFHLKIWIFTHGIATLLATETCDISEEQVSQMLTEEFRALMLLEKGDNKNEK